MINSIYTSVVDGALFTAIGWGTQIATETVVPAVIRTLNSSAIKTAIPTPALLNPFTGLVVCGTYFVSHFIIDKIFTALFPDYSNQPAFQVAQFALALSLACTIGFFAFAVSPIITVALIITTLIIDNLLKKILLENSLMSHARPIPKLDL